MSPIYLAGNSIEEPLSARAHYPRSSRCVPCEPHGPVRWPGRTDTSSNSSCTSARIQVSSARASSAITLHETLLCSFFSAGTKELQFTKCLPKP